MTKWCGVVTCANGSTLRAQGGATRGAAVKELLKVLPHRRSPRWLIHRGFGAYEVRTIATLKARLRAYVFSPIGAGHLVRPGWSTQQLYTTCRPRQGSPLRVELRPS